MVLFVIFIFGAVILGAGAMLSPAWPTPQPRVGLAAALALAIITGGAVFLAALFGWDTLLIDYLLFALVVGIFLGGTLSVGQSRAERKGETLEDADQGWTGPQDLGMFALIGLAFTLMALALPLPLGDDAQVYGLLALTVREGGTLDTLAPFAPEITYLYAPGFSVLTAYLSQQLQTAIPVTQFAVGAVLSLLNVWLAYDFGGELRDKRLGRAMGLAMLAGLGLLGAFLHGHHPALLGLLFAQAFFIYAIRYSRDSYPMDAVAAGLMLGAVVIASPVMALAVVIGYVPWLLVMRLAALVPDYEWLRGPDVRGWLVMAFGVPLVAVLALAPWLADVAPLLGADGPESPFTRDVGNLFVLVQYHGLWMLGGIALGGWLGWQRRDPVAVLALVWLFFIVDFSVSGGFARLLPFLDRYNHPFYLAWHAPIIPLTLLSGPALLWLWERFAAPRVGGLSYRGAYLATGALALIVVGLFLVRDSWRGVMQDAFDEPGVLLSAGDLAALDHLRDTTEFAGTRVLNPPMVDDRRIDKVGLVQESGFWLPAYAERASVHWPEVPFATADITVWEAIREERAALDAFWVDPAQPGGEALLRAAGITHVFVPAWLAPDFDWRATWRLNPPPDLPRFDVAALTALPYLEVAFEQDGAQVYRVLPPPDAPTDVDESP